MESACRNSLSYAVPLVTEKSPFLADVDALLQDTKAGSLHPALAQFIENLQLQSKSNARSEIEFPSFTSTRPC